MRLLVLFSFLVLLNGCTVLRVARAWLQNTSEFKTCTPDLRVLCEPGSEVMAQTLIPFIENALMTVEHSQFSTFSAPIKIYTYASAESYSLHSGAHPETTAAVSMGVAHISPKISSVIATVLPHEFSHLHLQQKIGSWAWAKIPSWFHEGLATFVSNGGGAETINNEQAQLSINQGKHFFPDDTQNPLQPKSAYSYGLQPHMYYRQAAMFVEYLKNSHPKAFRSLLLDIQNKEIFADSVEKNFGFRLTTLWLNFLQTLRI